MEKFYEIYGKYEKYVLFLVLLILLIISEVFLFLYFDYNISSVEKISEKKDNVVIKEESLDVKQFVVEIKGEVKKPGVYSLDEGKRVNDVIKKAGGLTKYADISVNNLRMKIFDEMVIIIYSADEVNDYLSTKKEEKLLGEKCNTDIVKNDSCIDSNNKSNSTESNNKSENNSSYDSTSGDASNEEDTGSKLISINEASKEELMTISGIGESKALAIIEYRKENRFEKIEDIKNVSGIGDSLFEKIKDYITT